MDILTPKRCSKCRTYKSRSDFYKDRARPDGLRTACKVCCNTQHSTWVDENPERVRELDMQRHERHRDRRNESRRLARAKNPEHFRAGERRKYELHKERILARNRRWCKAYPEKRLAQIQRRRASKAAAKGNHTGADILAKLELQGGLCYYCAEPLTVYHIDHKIPLSKGGSNWPANLCCACPSCNSRKKAQSFWAFIQKMTA